MKKGEGKAMKKDIEWLRNLVLELKNNGNPEINKTEKERELGRAQQWAWNNCIDRVYELINQLDEPEVLSQEWIDEHRKSYTMEDSVEISELQNLLVPKQELPVIPEFVAEWIEHNQEDDLSDTIHFTIYGLYAVWPDTNNMVELRKPVLKWLGEDRNNYFKLIDAARYGYEVEAEQKYHALIKGHELVHDYDIYWNYDKSNHDVFVSKLYPPHDNFTTEMTEQEWFEVGINDTNADFVKVEELEE